MSHYTKEQWEHFASGSEVVRGRMEEHLASCDDCLALYVEAVSSDHADRPRLRDVRAFAEAVIAAAERTNRAEAEPRQSRWFAKPVFQYLIAASITLVLVGSGAFEQLFDRFAEASRETADGNAPAISERWTDKASEWLDTLPVKQGMKEGINHE